MTTPSIRIIPATPEYAPGMQEVYYRTWLATYPNAQHGITVEDIEDSYKDTFTEKALEAVRERIRALPPNVRIFIALDGEKVAAVSRAVLHDDKNELQTMYVLPEYQGRGIGMRMWETVKRYFDPAKPTIVDVASYNARAIEFYMKLGFEDTGERFTDERFRMKSGSIVPQMRMKLRA